MVLRLFFWVPGLKCCCGAGSLGLDDALYEMNQFRTLDVVCLELRGLFVEDSYIKREATNTTCAGRFRKAFVWTFGPPPYHDENPYRPSKLWYLLQDISTVYRFLKSFNGPPPRPNGCRHDFYCCTNDSVGRSKSYSRTEQTSLHLGLTSFSTVNCCCNYLRCLSQLPKPVLVVVLWKRYTKLHLKCRLYQKDARELVSMG